jgi:hypothetical protein
MKLKLRKTAWVAGVVVLGLAGCGGSKGDPAAPTTPPVTGGNGISGGTGTDTGTSGGTSASACALFPSNAIFYARIDGLPTHANSDAWVNAVGGSTPFHGDWGSNGDPNAKPFYGIPVNVVDGTTVATNWPRVAIAGAGESDCGVQAGGAVTVNQGCTGSSAGQARFPFPNSNPLVEGGNPITTGDRHILVQETGACRLWEAANVSPNSDGSWQASFVAAWDLKSNAMRPSTWTSADAAGLPMMPLLVRAAEAQSGEIRHAMRMTLDSSVMAKTFVWPASHHAGTNTGSIPFGALLRLKANFTIPANWSVQSKAVAVAMQRYGMYVADNGTSLYVQGDPSGVWSSAVFDELRTIKMSNFEFVDASSAQAAANSYAAK